jgi:hypothetical protein
MAYFGLDSNELAQKKLSVLTSEPGKLGSSTQDSGFTDLCGQKFS